MAMIARKAALRNEVKKVLRNMRAVDRTQQSKDISDKLFASKVFLRSERLSIYLSTKEEVCTEQIVKRCFDMNKSVFIPRYVGDQMDMLRLYSNADLESLPETKWKIKQPADNDNTRENAERTGGLDLILVPGLAFTKSGHRLGRGKGYYDRSISRFSECRTKPVLVGLAFNEQIVTDIPISETDRSLDFVLFPAQDISLDDVVA